jgi:hypothetical protein
MRKSGRRGASLQPKAIEEEIAHLGNLDLTGLRTHWHNEFGRPNISPGTCCSESSPTKSRPIALVIWTLILSKFWIELAAATGGLRLSPRSSPRWTRGVLRPRRGRSWSGNGIEKPIGSW